MSELGEPYWNSFRLLEWVYLGHQGRGDLAHDEWSWRQAVVLDERGKPASQLIKEADGKPSVLKLQIRAIMLRREPRVIASDNELATESEFQAAIHSGLEDAEKEIMRSLQGGTLIGTGEPENGARREILPLEWLDLVVEFDENIALHKRSRSRMYCDLKFSRQLILGIWPDRFSEPRPSAEPHSLLLRPPSDSASAGALAPTPKARKQRRDETRPEIIEALKALLPSDNWGGQSDKERCILIERHLEKPAGWCKPRTLRRAIEDYEKTRH